MTNLATVFSTRLGGYWGSKAGEADHEAKAIRNGDVGTSGEVRWEALPDRSYSAREFTTARVLAGDIVLTTSGNCGNVAHIREMPPQPTVATNYVRILRVDPRVADSRYAFYFLRSSRFRAGIAPFVRGATIKNLSVEAAFAAIDMPLPDLEEQRRIAAILDHADALRAKRRQMLVSLNSLSDSMFDVVSTYAADEVSLGDVATLHGGTSLPAGRPFAGQANGTLLMKVSDMNAVGNEVRVAGTALWTDSPTARAATVAAGAVVLPKRGAAIATNKKRITTRRTALDPNLMGIQPFSDRLDTRYLFSWLRFFDLVSITSGSAVPQLNKRDLAPLRIPLPPLDVQRSYAAREMEIDAHSVMVRRALDTLDELFASLQHRAFRGEL